MPKRPPVDLKLITLQEHASLNPRPQAVTDPPFRNNDFFDPRDLVQVKYETLRRVRVEGRSVRRPASTSASPAPRSIRPN
jgi:hypothetical protein